MKWIVFMFAALASSSWAGPADDLAIETYRHLVSSESLLQGAINSGNPDKYRQFIWKPAVNMMQRWPAVGDPTFDKYFRCRSAVIQYVNYSEEQFKAAGQLPKNSSSLKDYFEQRSQCKKALNGRV